jgi:uncharacterized protein
MRHPEGLFGWIDLGTTDVEAARAFYEGIFGWESTDIATPVGVNYTSFTLNGQRVAGMGPQTPVNAAAGRPSTWNSYVLVDDIEATVKRVEAAGGTVVIPPMDVMTEGRLAMAVDPTGATVGLWQPMNHQGAEIFNVPGALTWNELQTRNPTAAKAFYTDVFGWRWTDMDGSTQYYVGNVDAKPGDDKSNNGLLVWTDDVPAEVPNGWAIYFAVANCDEAVEAGVGLGAEVVMPPTDMGPGRFAGLKDPTGAVFYLAYYPAQ